MVRAASRRTTITCPRRRPATATAIQGEHNALRAPFNAIQRSFSGGCFRRPLRPLTLAQSVPRCWRAHCDTDETRGTAAPAVPALSLPFHPLTMPSFSSHDVPDDLPCCSRLARKAESARQARLRHKQFVTDLQEQAATLQAGLGSWRRTARRPPEAPPWRSRSSSRRSSPSNSSSSRDGCGRLKAKTTCSHGMRRHAAATHQVRGANGPLDDERRSGEQLCKRRWIGAHRHRRRRSELEEGVSIPMESDEGDGGSFPMSRSWDDCEVARHPQPQPPNGHLLQGLPMGGARTRSRSAVGVALPPMMPSHQAAMGSMLGVQRNRAS